MDITSNSPDTATAAAFSSSWNTLPLGSVYTLEQIIDWFAPVQLAQLRDKQVLELGCGGGNILTHILKYEPEIAVGVDLGDSVFTAERNLKDIQKANWSIVREDLCSFESKGFDFVYCIGVLHHLKNPYEGFLSVLRNTKPGGSFHCWVYAHEGNIVIRLLVEPLRWICSKLPWWLTKYGVALPLSALYFLYAKLLSKLPLKISERFPIGPYSLWIAKREFRFFHHVAFDQLVTPQTIYIKKETIEKWLNQTFLVDQSYSYIVLRNGNSWKFGGRRTLETVK